MATLSAGMGGGIDRVEPLHVIVYAVWINLISCKKVTVEPHPYICRDFGLDPVRCLRSFSQRIDFELTVLHLQ